MYLARSLSILSYATTVLCATIPQHAAPNATSLTERSNIPLVYYEPAPYYLQILADARHTGPEANSGGVYAYPMVMDAGKGVDIYLFDSGVNRHHEAFKNADVRHFGKSSDTDISPYCQEYMTDTMGHGTAMASIMVGAGLGVAPAATVWNVKVKCPGLTTYTFKKAIEDVTARHIEQTKAGGSFRGSIINFSFRVDDAKQYGEAIEAASKAGIAMFASAGNASHDASVNSQYPCNFEWVTCVGAIDNTLRRAPFSNWGSTVNVFAPGWNIDVADYNDNKNRLWSDGTSDATALTSSVAAIFTSWNGLADGSAVNGIDANAVEGLIKDLPKGTPNSIVQTGMAHHALNPDEPFYGGGQKPLDGIRTKGFFENKKMHKRDALSATHNPTKILDDDTIQGGTDGAPPAAENVKSQAFPKWKLDFYLTTSNGCTGKSFASVTGTGNTADGRGSSLCLQANPIKTDSSITGCVTAQNFNGHACVLKVFSDQGCKTQIKYPDGGLGYFGQVKVNKHISFGQITFKSYSVQC